jgi:hypothetical protein
VASRRLGYIKWNHASSSKSAASYFWDPDQVSADVVAVGKPVKGFAAQELLSDLALELDAVCAVLGRGLPSFESRLDRQFCLGGTMFSAQYRQRLVPPDGNLVRRG